MTVSNFLAATYSTEISLIWITVLMWDSKRLWAPAVYQAWTTNCWVRLQCRPSTSTCPSVLGQAQQGSRARLRKSWPRASRHVQPATPLQMGLWHRPPAQLCLLGSFHSLALRIEFWSWWPHHHRNVVISPHQVAVLFVWFIYTAIKTASTMTTKQSLCLHWVQSNDSQQLIGM